MAKIKIIDNPPVGRVFVDGIEINGVTKYEVKRCAGEAPVQVIITVGAHELDMDLRDAVITKRPSHCIGGAKCGRDRNGVWHCECVTESKTKR